MRQQRSAWLSGWLVALAAGCMFVAPLEDLPEASGGKPSRGGEAGSVTGFGGAEDAGAAGNGASAGDAGAGNQGSGGTKPDGPCETNAECVQRFSEAPARCRPSDHRCVPLLNDVCPFAYGDAKDPNAIFFGAFTTFDEAAIQNNSISWAHQLALVELSGNNIGGLPDGPGGKRRPLVMSLCSNLTEDVDAAMEHLADELEVPAVIATLRPGDLRRVYDEYIDRKLLYLSPVTVTQTLVEQDEQNLIWNLLGTPTDLAPVYRPLLLKTEAFVRDERGLEPGIALRVALVTTPEAFDSELGAAIPDLLELNGKTVAENGGNYRGFTIDPEEPELDEVAASIIEFRPHVILSAAGDILSREGGLLSRVEEGWELGVVAPPEGLDFRPQWILSPYNAGNLEWLAQVIKGSISVAGRGMEQRFVGISIAGPTNTTLQNSYASRLRTKFPKAYLDSANYYDALYFLAYGMYAAPAKAPLDGPGIARGLGRLLEGKAFNIGPLTISSVFDALSDADATIKLNSTLGPASFDPKTGVRAVSGSVFCFEPSGGDVTLRTDVLRYDAQTQQLVGDKFDCFSGFLE